MKARKVLALGAAAGLAALIGGCVKDTWSGVRSAAEQYGLVNVEVYGRQFDDTCGRVYPGHPKTYLFQGEKNGLMRMEGRDIPANVEGIACCNESGQFCRILSLSFSFNQ